MENNVLAVVAGYEITEAELNTFMKGLPREQQMYASHPQFRAQCLENLMAIRMFAAEAVETKIDETEEFKKAMDSARTEILAQLAVANVMKGIKVEEDELKAYYEANLNQFEKGATVSAKHILVKEEEECNKILAAINAGEKSFEEAAKESSTCPSGQQGGSLGEFGKGQMVKEFEDAAFNAEIGTVVGPVKTQFGYHLILVEAKNEASVMAFDEVRGQIYSQVFAQKQNETYDAKVSALKEKYVK